MKIPGLPRCVDDECFSSWLYRCYKNRKLNKDFIFNGSASHLEGEPDYDLITEDFIFFVKGLNINLTFFINFFQPKTNWLLPWKQRLVYCPDCFDDDIASGRLPSWKKSWCYMHCPLCAVHGRLLVRSQQFKPGYDKSWAAFSSSKSTVLHDESCNNLLMPSVYNNVSKKTLRLALKVQYWLVKIHCAEYIFLPKSEKKINSGDVLYVCEFLFGHFLMPRTKRYEDGIALYRRKGMARDRCFSREEAKKAGCSDCDTYSRMIALLLIGWIFKLYPESKVKEIIELRWALLRFDLYWLGFQSVSFCSKEEYREARTGFSMMPKDLLNHISPFIAGIESGYRGGASISSENAFLLWGFPP